MASKVPLTAMMLNPVHVRGSPSLLPAVDHHLSHLQRQLWWPTIPSPWKGLPLGKLKSHSSVYSWCPTVQDNKKRAVFQLQGRCQAGCVVTSQMTVSAPPHAVSASRCPSLSGNTNGITVVMPLLSERHGGAKMLCHTAGQKVGGIYVNAPISQVRKLRPRAQY